MAIGEKTRAWREAKGLSQVALAEAIGISQPVLCAFEVSGKPLAEVAALQLQQLSDSELMAVDCVHETKRARVEELLKSWGRP